MSPARKLPSRCCPGPTAKVSGLAFLFLLLVGAHARLLAQSGISTEGPFTVFRTGTNEPLLTLSLPFDAPPTNSPSMLRFDFVGGASNGRLSVKDRKSTRLNSSHVE